MFFREDGTTIHTAHNSKANIFGDQNSHPLWPVRSPDLLPCVCVCVFFLGGGDSKYKNIWHIEDELEEITSSAV